MMLADVKIWNDGRSGKAGCAAGNAALAHLIGGGVHIRKLKGTVFESPEGLWVGRVCATDNYLTAGVAHWANISFDQHRDLSGIARDNNRELIYLFVTASESPPSVSYWRVPGEIVERALKHSQKNHPGGVFGLHITGQAGNFRLGTTDVSRHHVAVHLDEPSRRRLAAGFLASRKRQPLRVPSSEGQDDLPRSSATRGEQDPEENRSTRTFAIPLANGSVASLRVPIAIEPSDVGRLKGWLDLMADILTAGSTYTPEKAEGHRAASRSRASRANEL